MRQATILLAALTLALSASGAAKAFDLKTARWYALGEGSTSCKDFSFFLEHERPGVLVLWGPPEADVQWILGYISGLNIRSNNPTHREIGYYTITPDNTKTWLGVYCKDHPNDDMTTAALAYREHIEQEEQSLKSLKKKLPVQPPWMSAHSQMDLINKKIKYCVDVVHHFPTGQMQYPKIQNQYYRHFDAYFNSASGRVENNAMVNGDMPALYQFNKCMASQGIPLK